MLLVTTDVDEIISILGDPDILDVITDDDSKGISLDALRELVISSLATTEYVAAFRHNKTVGIMCVHPYKDSPEYVQVHVNVLPKYRGIEARNDALALFHYIFSTSDYASIVAVIPDLYPNVILSAQLVGMRFFEELPRRHIRDAKEHKNFLFKIDRAEYYGNGN